MFDVCFVKVDENHKMRLLCHVLGDGWAMSLDSVSRSQSRTKLNLKSVPVEKKVGRWGKC